MVFRCNDRLCTIDIALSLGVMAGSPCPIEVMRQVIDKMHMPHITVSLSTVSHRVSK